MSADNSGPNEPNEEILLRQTHSDFNAPITSDACLGLAASKSYRFSAPSRYTMILKVEGDFWFCLQDKMDVAWNEEVFMLSKNPLLSVGMIWEGVTNH